MGEEASLERIHVTTHGVSFLVFRPWREELLQGVTLRPPPNGSRRGIAPIGEGPVEGRWPRQFPIEVLGDRSKVVVGMEQVHGPVVKTVEPSKSDRQFPSNGIRILEGCDGLVTDSAEYLLTAYVADCVPIFLYDKARGTIGLLHAGWRGTAQRILQVGIERMREKYGTYPSDLTVYMGPSIERACYSVGRDVYDRFSRWTDRYDSQSDRWSVDLPGVNERQAIEVGVRKEEIHRSRFCTSCSTDLFYSYRASKGGHKRMAAFIGLRK